MHPDFLNQDGWNRFDFVIVLVGYLDYMPLDTGGDGDSKAFMVLRVLRLFKVRCMGREWIPLSAVRSPQSAVRSPQF